MRQTRISRTFLNTDDIKRIIAEHLGVSVIDSKLELGEIEHIFEVVTVHEQERIPEKRHSKQVMEDGGIFPNPFPIKV